MTQIWSTNFDFYLRRVKTILPPPKKNANQKILQIFDFYGRVVYIELRWNDIFRETAFSISLSLLLTHKPAVTGWRSQRAHRTFCCLIIEGKFNFEPVRNPTTPISLFLTFATDWWMLSKKYYGEKVFR